MTKRQVELMHARSIIPVRIINLELDSKDVMIRGIKDRLAPTRYRKSLPVGTSCALVKAICGMSMGRVLGTVHWMLGHFRDGCQLHCAQSQRRAGRVWLAFCCMSSAVTNSQELWSGSTADNDTKLLIQVWSRLHMLMWQSVPRLS